MLVRFSVMATDGFPNEGVVKQMPSTTRGRKILVVDDERVIADTLVAILNVSGYSASAAYNGDSALAAIGAAIPDMLISDVCMPGMNGIELAMQVRQRYPQCMVLLFSGHA